jgi:hypothetical protein
LSRQVDLYVDMDETICDFRGKFTQLYGPQDWDNEEEFMKHWHKFILDGYFIHLDWTNYGKYLMDGLQQMPYFPNIIMLSSTGRRQIPLDYQKIITQDKEIWLEMHQIPFKLITVHTTEKEADNLAKARYASPMSFLIDDSLRNINAFQDAGGAGYLYEDDELIVEDILSATYDFLDSHHQMSVSI